MSADLLEEMRASFARINERLDEVQLALAGRRVAPQQQSLPVNEGELPAVFPPYGRSKGLPISGATVNDLEFYANGARRSLADPAKAKWHDKDRAMLAAIEKEQGQVPF